MNSQDDFLRFYDQYKDKIYTYFWYRVGYQQAVAEDLTSEVFLKAFRHFDSFDRSRPFRSWIYAIAHNHLVDHYQKHIQEVELEEAGQMSTEHPAEIHSCIDNKNEVAAIMKVIRGLKPYHREVLLLRYVDGLSNTEISAILQKDDRAVRAQVSRAMAELRKRLGESTKE